MVVDQSSYMISTNKSHFFGESWFSFLELDEGEQNACWSVLLSEFERFSLETVSTFVADSELSLSFKSTNKNPTWR